MSDPTGPPPQDGGNTPPPAYQAPPGGYASYGSYPQEPGYSADPGPVASEQKPSLFMRFLARVLDNILVGIVAAVIDAVLLVSIFGLSRTGSDGFTMAAGTAGGHYAYAALSGLIGGVLALAYFVLMETRNNGQTVGKLATRLRVRGAAGGAPTVEESARRNFWVALGALAIIPVIGGLIGSIASLVIVILIAVTINSSPTGQGWHDRLAHGTRVIRTV